MRESGILAEAICPHELVGSPGEPCVEERAEVVLQFGIGRHDGENLLVGLVQELDRMGGRCNTCRPCRYGGTR